jgi:hypothetical protein
MYSMAQQFAGGGGGGGAPASRKRGRDGGDDDDDEMGQATGFAEHRSVGGAPAPGPPALII